MLGMIELLFRWLASLVKGRRWLEAENLVLRHQVNGEHSAAARPTAPLSLWQNAYSVGTAGGS
jgi:hypothetical protein